MRRLKFRSIKMLYLQILFVVFTFILMVISSYFFARNLERGHLSETVESALTNIESIFVVDLKELETTLGVVSETIRGMFLQGFDLDVVKAYMVDMTNYGMNIENIEGFFGFFAGFGEDGLNGFNALHPDADWEEIIASGYNPKERPWYIAAETSANKIVMTEPYADEITKEVTFTYVRNIYDNDGKRLGIICMDVSLDKIYKFFIDNHNSDLGFWSLHDNNNVIIAHPNQEFIGKNFREIDSKFKVYADELEEKGFITNRFANNYLGKRSVFSMRRQENGWYIGVVINTFNYYDNLNIILFFLIVLGTLSSVLLIIILIRINVAKEKSDKRAWQAIVERNAQKKAELEIAKKNEQLENALRIAEKANRAKSAFLANMSHEIRTPMNAILGITEIQLRDQDLSKEMEENLEKIYDSGNLLLSIINDILDLSKIEAGKLELLPVKYDIPSLINDTVQINRLRYDSKPIDFLLDVNENTSLNLIGDELRIKQILGNILSNAFKYTDKGEIRMSVCSEEKNDNEVILIFEVSDTGHGMTQEQIKTIFDEYTRFNIEANRTTVGTGLGMSITKRLINLMNGDIFIKSEVNKGSVFTVKIPQKRIDDLVCGKKRTEKLRTFHYQNASMSKKTRMFREYMPYGKVLIVDDGETNIYVTKGMLLPYGVHVDTSASGFEAIEKVKAGNVYDIIFMDHMMPKMDGIEATKIIRGAGYKNCIIALTANALVGQAEMFLENGFDGFISKPIDSRELNKILIEFIRNKQPQEIVAAANRDAAARNELNNNEMLKTDYELEKFFLIDAKNAITVMEKFIQDKAEEKDINNFEIASHGMKSALANIGEKELSLIAQKLEMAAKEKRLSIIEENTPEFIDKLNSIIKKYNKEKQDLENSLDEEDKAFLLEKLNEIKEACVSLDSDTAINLLNGLNNKQWHGYIEDLLDEINVHLLHSAFKKAATAIDNCLEYLN